MPINVHACHKKLMDGDYEWILSGYEVPKGCCENSIEASPKSVLFEQRALSPRSPAVPDGPLGTAVPVPAQVGETGGSLSR